MLFLAMGPSLALSLFEAALEVRIETVVASALDLGFDAAVFVNPLLGEGSVGAPNLSGPGVVNDHEAEPHLGARPRQDLTR